MSLAVLLVSGMVLIVLSADYFTNGVEWLGHALALGEGVSGSLLAALGTALPETLVPLIAFVFGKTATDQAIGLGAILGAPLMLSTLGFAMIGLGVWWSGRGGAGLSVLNSAATRDLRFFLIAFAVAVAASFMPAPWHPLAALLLVGGYLLHAVRLVRERPRGQTPAPEQSLHLWHSQSQPRPPGLVIWSQVALALAGLMVGAHVFVTALGQVTGWVRVSGFLVSVVMTPVATELPEVLNSVMWLRRRKDTLAVGNVTGALAFQASLVPALGLTMTSWHFTPPELAASLVAWGAGAWVLLRARDGILDLSELAMAGAAYLVFVAAVAWLW